MFYVLSSLQVSELTITPNGEGVWILLYTFPMWEEFHADQKTVCNIQQIAYVILFQKFLFI